MLGTGRLSGVTTEANASVPAQCVFINRGDGVVIFFCIGQHLYGSDLELRVESAPVVPRIPVAVPLVLRS